MEGNERATHGLELLELFIGNNICCPFLLVVNQWQFMVEGPLYWGTVRCVDSSICKNRGIRNRLPGPQGTEILTPGTATRISLVVGQSQAWPCLGVAQKQKGRMLRGGRDDFRPAQQHLNSRGEHPMHGDIYGHTCSEVTWQSPMLSEMSLHILVGLFRKLGLPT